MASPSSRRFVIDMYSSRYPAWCMPEEDVRRIRDSLPDDWEVVRVTEEADGSGDGVARVTPALLEAIRDAEIYCGFGIARELFDAAARLSWVHSGTAGVGGSLFPELVESDVIFTNSAGIHAVPVAEHAVAMMFYFARAFDRVDPAQSEGRWNHDRVSGFDGPIREITDAVVTVLGYGGIGREVGRRAHGLGMRVWAVKRDPGRGVGAEVERVVAPDHLDSALGAADFVVITAPHTPETDRLIGARELGLLKPEAVIINVARGRIVDEQALTDALASNRIRGAGLDVFEREPLPADSPLWELDNVCLTPHVAGISPRFWERETELILENTSRYLADEPMRNVVDKQAGY